MQKFNDAGLSHKTIIDLLRDDFGRDHKGLVIGCKMQDRFGRLYDRLRIGNGQPMDNPVDRRGEGEPRQLLFQSAAICAQPQLLGVQIAKGCNGRLMIGSNLAQPVDFKFVKLRLCFGAFGGSCAILPRSAASCC